MSMKECPLCKDELDDGYCHTCEKDLYDEPEWLVERFNAIIDSKERQIDDLIARAASLDHTTKKYKARVLALEDGECRFHCRMRKDMWKAGAIYVFENWEKLARPADIHLEQMYTAWRKKHD